MSSHCYVLFPGRHHAVTRFQVDYLDALLAGRRTDTSGRPIEMTSDALVLWAVTSASHANTRRNPLPGHRREALVERVTAVTGLPSLVVPVPDVPAHPRFADLVVTTVATTIGHLPAPTPDNTVVACSTAAVAADYAALGYRVAGVEADVDPRPAGPWQVVEACAADDDTWRDWAHPETVAFWDRYGVPDLVRRLFADPVVSAEGDLTSTRDYRTYADAFERASRRKWDIVAPHLEPGRVVDIGCATGGLLEHAAADPRFAESDLFGVDVARPLLAEAEHKKTTGVFANPNIWFVAANALTQPVMPEGSVDSTVTVALTHEIASYGNGLESLATFASRIHEHTRPGGVWVNSDVLGPSDPDRVVELHLAVDDGDRLEEPWTDLDELTGAEVTARLAPVCTHARMVQFAYDFPRLSGARFSPRRIQEGRWLLTVREAMEFMTRKDYVDNWLSECHERFCDLAYADWERVLAGAGFRLAPASGPVRNEWLVDHRFAPCARLVDPVTGRDVEWPATHVLTVAVRDTAERSPRLR